MTASFASKRNRSNCLGYEWKVVSMFLSSESHLPTQFKAEDILFSNDHGDRPTMWFVWQMLVKRLFFLFYFSYCDGWRIFLGSFVIKHHHEIKFWPTVCVKVLVHYFFSMAKPPVFDLILMEIKVTVIRRAEP